MLPFLKSYDLSGTYSIRPLLFQSPRLFLSLLLKASFDGALFDNWCNLMFASLAVILTLRIRIAGFGPSVFLTVNSAYLFWFLAGDCYHA